MSRKKLTVECSDLKAQSPYKFVEQQDPLCSSSVTSLEVPTVSGGDDELTIVSDQDEVITL